MASTIQPLNDTTELVELLGAQHLYLKPISRLNVTVQLPALKDPTKSISNWDIMEKLKRLIAPGYFSSIKVSKSSLEFVRFEAEVDNRETLQKTIKILDNANLKVIGFFDTLKVKASEAKSEFPTKHMWDSYFRDAKNVDETKPGERPDTLYLDKLPSKWFQDMRPNKGQASRDQAQPSEFVLRRVFEVFGDIRCVDIPQMDPSRMATCIPLMKPVAMTSSTELGGAPAAAPGPSYASTASSIRPFNFGADFTFDAYVQYVEYIGFVKAMDALRNMKLVCIEEEDGGKALAANIKVDFDRSKHLSDKNIRRRRIIREKFLREEKIRLEKLRREEEERQRRVEEERLRIELERKFLEKQIFDRRRDREEKRKIKKLEEKRREEENKIEQKIKYEERKLTVAQRKLESIRLLGELFKLVKPIKLKEKVERELLELEEAQKREQEEKMRQKREEEAKRERYMRKKESELRERVLKNYSEIEYQREEYKREQVRKMVRSNGGLLSSVVATSAPKKPQNNNNNPYQNQYYQQQSSSLGRNIRTNASRADYRPNNNRYYYQDDNFNNYSGRYYEDGTLSDYYEYEYVPLPKRHRVVYESYL